MAGHGNSELHVHVTPFNNYIKVFSALVIMTVITVVAARFDFGMLNTIIAMAIATAKATLVLLFFMHLKYDGKLFPAIFGTSVFFLILLYLICEIDMVTRIVQKGF